MIILWRCGALRRNDDPKTLPISKTKSSIRLMECVYLNEYGGISSEIYLLENFALKNFQTSPTRNRCNNYKYRRSLQTNKSKLKYRLRQIALLGSCESNRRPIDLRLTQVTAFQSSTFGDTTNTWKSDKVTQPEDQNQGARNENRSSRRKSKT